MATEERPPAEAASPESPQLNRKNVLTIIKDLPISRKIALAAVVLISVGLFTILIIQGRTADYQLLYANLDESDAASVVNWLKTQRIPYDLKNGGKNIWIPSDKLYETRLELAANGLPTGGGVGFEIFDQQSFALTDYVQKVNLTRALQGELARTITSLAPVESTRVHLALPEKRLFKNQQAEATASVIVTLAQGKTLDKKQVQGIVHLVAGSVPELKPENVKIIDSNGDVLEAAEGGDKDKLLSADMFAFQQQVEQRLEIRAQDLLDKTMGKDKAMVRVTATLDFSKVEKTEELFDAEEPVVRSEQVSQENSGTQTTGGIPGVQSNLQGNSGGQTTTGPGASKSSRTTNFEISKTINKVVNPVGTITKLSVSVLVADKEEPAAEAGKPAKTTPRTAEELKSMENMVSAALGLLPSRGDQISVLSMPFTEHPEEQALAGASPASLLYDYMPLIKIGLLFVGALLLYFLLIRPIIKTMKGEVSQHYKTVEELQRQQAAAAVEEEIEIVPVDEAVSSLRREVMRNHIPTAHIIKNWLQEG